MIRIMERADFLRAVREHQSLDKVDLSSADPFVADLGGLSLRGANLSRSAKPTAAGSDFWPGGPAEPYVTARRRVRARGADLFSANLTRVLGARADFRDANLTGARFVEADLTDADFRGADLSGADLTGAAFEGARFENATWDEKTIWPDGFRPAR